MLFVEVLKFLQTLAISLDAKSLSAQWLSTSGLVHSWRLTMHVVADGMSSCRYFSRKSVWFSSNDLTMRIR